MHFPYFQVEAGPQGQKLSQAMDAIERRERYLRIPEKRERHRYHEKGYNKVGGDCREGGSLRFYGKNRISHPEAAVVRVGHIVECWIRLVAICINIFARRVLRCAMRFFVPFFVGAAGYL